MTISSMMNINGKIFIIVAMIVEKKHAYYIFRNEDKYIYLKELNVNDLLELKNIICIGGKYYSSINNDETIKDIWVLIGDTISLPQNSGLN